MTEFWLPKEGELWQTTEDVLIRVFEYSIRRVEEGTKVIVTRVDYFPFEERPDLVFFLLPDGVEGFASLSLFGASHIGQSFKLV